MLSSPPHRLRVENCQLVFPPNGCDAEAQCPPRLIPSFTSRHEAEAVHRDKNTAIGRGGGSEREKQIIKKKRRESSSQPVDKRVLAQCSITVWICVSTCVCIFAFRFAPSPRREAEINRERASEKERRRKNATRKQASNQATNRIGVDRFSLSLSLSLPRPTRSLPFASSFLFHRFHSKTKTHHPPTPTTCGEHRRRTTANKKKEGKREDTCECHSRAYWLI